MKKVLSLLFIISVLTTSVFGKMDVGAHNKLVEEYLEVSGQGYAFKTMPIQMINMLEQQFASVGQKTSPQVLNLMIEELTREETVQKMTEHIRKLSSEDFNKLIAFYNTKAGQKCASLNREEGMEKLNEELPAFAQELQENPPSQHRIESMNKMFIETNILTGTLEMVESIIRIFNASFPKEQQMNSEQLDEVMLNMRETMANQLIVSFYYALRNFSDKEIDEIVQITLTPEGQAETDAQLADLTGYFNAVTNNLVNAIAEL
jgi:hypothetical protein